jgi:hypothetical protein
MKSAQGLLPTNREVAHALPGVSQNVKLLVKVTLLCGVTMLMLLLTAR